VILDSVGFNHLGEGLGNFPHQAVGGIEQALPSRDLRLRGGGLRNFRARFMDCCEKRDGEGREQDAEGFSREFHKCMDDDRLE
jgi:hypothetical protein